MIVPAAGGHPFDGDSLEARLTWILGSPRTGSTWLLRLLAHPLLLAQSAEGFKAPFGTRFGPDTVVPIDEPYLPVHLTPALHRPYEDGTRPQPADYIENTARERDPSYFFSDEYAPNWRPAVRRMVLARFNAQVERGVGESAGSKVQVAIKEPNGSHGAERLMSLFPRSKLIFLIRDGRDVINSLIVATRQGGWLAAQTRHLQLDHPQHRANFIRGHSWRWVIRMEAVERAYSQHDPALRFEIRYEELSARPGATLHRLANWLGIDRSEDDLEASLEAARSRKPSPGWRQNLTEREHQIMGSVMGAKLDELGYEPTAPQ